MIHQRAARYAAGSASGVWWAATIWTLRVCSIDVLVPFINVAGPVPRWLVLAEHPIHTTKLRAGDVSTVCTGQTR